MERVRKDEKEAIIAGKKEQELRGRKRLDVTAVNITVDAYTREVREDLESVRRGKFSEWIRSLIREKMEQIAEEEGLNERAYQQLGDILLILLANPPLTDAEITEYAKGLPGEFSVKNASREELIHRLRTLRSIGFVSGTVDKGWNLTYKGRRFLRKKLSEPSAHAQ